MAAVDPDAVFKTGIDSGEADEDAIDERGGDVFPDVIGADRQLAVAAVDERGELNARGASEVGERIHRGAAGAACVGDVIDEDDRAALEFERELRRGDV